MKLTQDIIRKLIKEEVGKIISEVTDSEIETNAVSQISSILMQVKEAGLNTEEIINKATDAFEQSQAAAAALGEKLDKGATVEDHITDFEDSDAPQFKGKSKEKRREMAVAAYLDAKDNK